MNNESLDDKLDSLYSLAKTLPTVELVEFLAALEKVRLAAFLRLINLSPESRDDELLNVEQTAARLHVSQPYVYRNAKRFPFTRRMGRKLLFSSAALNAYLRRRSR